MSLRDILSPSLTGETSLQNATPVLRKVFANDLYEVFLCRYPARVTALIHYRKDELRIMTRLWPSHEEVGAPAAQSPADDAWVETALARLRKEGRGPHHLAMAAKLECGLMLTLHDRAAMRMAGVEVPRSAGRFKDLFQ